MVVAHAAWLACGGGLACFMHVCTLGAYLLWFLITSACLTIASLCNTYTLHLRCGVQVFMGLLPILSPTTQGNSA